MAQRQSTLTSDNQLNLSTIEKISEQDDSAGSKRPSHEDPDDKSQGVATTLNHSKGEETKNTSDDREKRKDASTSKKDSSDLRLNKSKSESPDKGKADDGEEEDGDEKLRVRIADRLEEEKDYVKLSSVVNFFQQELQMTRRSDQVRLYDLFEVILINAQMANPERISRFHALRAFTEKIEVQVPLDVFFFIGINAKIDDENSENQWLEKVFNFYSQLMPDNYKAASGMDPDHRMKFTG